ncbi:hypothetical protein [Fibrisoma limi]|uniref:hypothetical protein n=1 Tax=Fibrisoma limi TaxID=663275 RepID=UPI001788C7C8|nr:hypothetical protein [Fibrisoma limi]
MFRLLFYLLLGSPFIGYSQVRHTDSISRGKYLTVINFSADHKGFCLMEQRTNRLTKVSELNTWSGSLATVDADSTRTFIHHVNGRSYIWIKLQAQAYGDFFYSKSVSKADKPIKHTEGTTKYCTVELPYNNAKAFLKEVW